MNIKQGVFDKLENINCQLGGQVGGVGKSHVPNPPCHMKHVRKGEKKYIKKTLMLKARLYFSNQTK
jgi:hypothetical protein